MMKVFYSAEVQYSYSVLPNVPYIGKWIQFHSAFKVSGTLDVSYCTDTQEVFEYVERIVHSKYERLLVNNQLHYVLKSIDRVVITSLTDLHLG